MSMRVAKMRQLLSRKSHPKLADTGDRRNSPSDVPAPFSPPLPSDLTSERVFQTPRLREDLEVPSHTDEHDDILGSVLNVIDEDRAQSPKLLDPQNSRRLAPSPIPSRGSSRDNTRIVSSAAPHSARNGHVSVPEPENRRHDQSDKPRKVSERIQYAANAKNGPPRVITGPVGHSTVPAYRRCEDEPIHTPGAVQSFGALVGLQYSKHGDLEVRVASENARRILGYGPEQLFALQSFLDILLEQDRSEMIARVGQALANVDALKDETRLDVFQMTLTFPYEPDARLWCAIHLAPNPKNMVICEFEEYADAFYLKDVGAARMPPMEIAPSEDQEASLEDIRKSTTSYSKPLPALTVARSKQNKEFSPLDVFNAMTQAQKQVGDCKDVQSILDVVVGVIAELTGFHRVMFYKFDSQHNGCIDAELLNYNANKVLFRGLHFPASDIPKQAREMYRVNRIRILHDREEQTSRLVARDESDFKAPLDLTHAYLRAISPIHLKYLANMAVRSTMSISIVIDSKLWGLIACHGYGDHGTRVSLPIRELCRSVGDCTALHIQRLLMLQRTEARRLPAPNTPMKNPTNLVASSSTDLLKFVDADFALLSVDEQIRAIGRMEPYHEALAIMSYLQSCRFSGIRPSQNIKADFPGLSYPPGINTLAGLLLIPLSVGKGYNFLVFFRRAQVKHVKWAGNPNLKTFQSGGEYLAPRTSFKRWVETIADTSKEWTEDQLDKAAVLAVLYGRFIESRRSQSATPPPPSPPTETAEAPVLSENERFDLHLTASRFLDALKKESLRKGLQLTMSVEEQLPHLVVGESERFKQLLVYFASNAFKESADVRIDITLLDTKDDTSMIRIRIQDTGPGLTEDVLDETFQKFEQAQGDGSMPNSAEARGKVHDDLVATAQYVRNMNGQIMVQSELGMGTIYTVDLLFDHDLSNDLRKKPRKIRSLLSAPQGPRKDALPMTPAPSVKSLASSEPQKPTLIAEQGKLTPPSETEFKRQSFRHTENSMAGSVRSQDRNTHAYARGNDTPSPASSMNSPVRDASKRLEILIVDNDATSLKVLDEKLSDWGHGVDFAHDGQDGHDRVASNPGKFDAILMELKMPAVDGVLSTRMIRLAEREANLQVAQSQHVPRVPVIAISASLEDDKRLQYIQTGIDGWISKPVDFGRLDLMLQGVTNPELRSSALYIPGQQKKSGWFMP